ncbi:MAG: molybdopterin-dependent oxidoreductase [Deltaproteobacteria bacterium]|jgi:sulfoxide reductase catalytic subunit YedY|nr:molybdopterin-dependent oxidoreductase [Deltaproteobacteria bacterium]
MTEGHFQIQHKVFSLRDVHASSTGKNRRKPISKKGNAVKTRRQFINLILGFIGVIGLVLSPIANGIRVAFAKAKKVILKKGTRMNALVGKNPANLDTRNLDLTPVEAFETMGLSDYQVDLNRWRLEIDGLVERPLKLGYAQVTEMPPVKKDVLLICPGFFAYHARWNGVSVAKLLDLAQSSSDVTHVSFSGPQGRYEKTGRFPIADILSGMVFLAYGVNGSVLPQKHGFPLRVVAQDYYGGDWVKYVYKVTAYKK